MGNKLIPRHISFIETYLGKANFNATKAAKIEGYAHPNTQGPRMLLNAGIKAEIELRMKTMVMSADETLTRLSEQSSSVYSNYLLPGGTVDLARLLADGKGHLIKGFKHTKDGVNVEFYDAQSALKTVAKHHGLLDDKLSIKIEGELGKLLDMLESNLDQETYDRILNIIESSQT